MTSSASENWYTQSAASNELASETNKIPNLQQTKTECLEDSLAADQTDNRLRTHEMIVEDLEEDCSKTESVAQTSESISKIESIANSCEMHDKQEPKFNQNNNNSVELESTKQKIKKRRRTENGNITIPLKSSQVPKHIMNKSIQTSCYIDKNLKSAPYKLNCNSVKERVKVVQPSFLSKLKKEAELEKPVYVLYPNYVLPDLNFLKEKEKDIANVYLIPQGVPQNMNATKRRPFSCNDVEALKRKGFSHVQDWDSLNFLLPRECRKILADVPEVAHLIGRKEEIKHQKPSFCASPPVRRRVRPSSCDCTRVLDRMNSDPVTTTSSSSSTATQPSSGYRGSSTMLLTDSQNSPAPTTNFNPLFVYRYDSVTSSEASLINSDRQRSITTMAAPPLPKRSISLSHDNKSKGEIVPPRPPLPKVRYFQNAALPTFHDR